MPSITYEYNRFEFKRRFRAPLPKDEFHQVKNDFEKFVAGKLDEAETQFKQLKNPHRFKAKTFFILLGTGGLFLGVDYLLKYLGYYDAGEIFAMLSFLPFFAIFLQPVRWVLSMSKSSSFSDYERAARNYYFFHHSKVNASVDYESYRATIANVTEEEFERFCHDREWSD